MKKFLWLAAVFVVAFAATASAQLIYTFTDQASFASWYSGSVLQMNDMGVITGYPDGSFRPGNNVTRAELAVILDRFYDEVGSTSGGTGTTILPSNALTESEVYELLSRYSAKDPDLPSWISVAIVMADSGLKKINLSSSEIDQLSVVQGYSLPDGYTLYEQKGIIFLYYLHYQGERLFGDYYDTVDEWYGPFSYF